MRHLGTLPSGCSSCPAGRRRGVLSMELVLTLPILGIVLMGLFEYSLLFLARGELEQASRTAARRATIAGSTAEDVEREVNRVLSRRLAGRTRIDVSGGPHSGDTVAVRLVIPMRDVAPDLLWPIGFSLKDRVLIAESRMLRE